MGLEWIQSTTVQKGGHLELSIPSLVEGTTVEVIVRSPETEALPERVIGLFAGKIRMSDDFDAPLEEFAKYM